MMTQDGLMFKANFLKKVDSKSLPDNNSNHKPPKLVIGVGRHPAQRPCSCPDALAPRSRFFDPANHHLDDLTVLQAGIDRELDGLSVDNTLPRPKTHSTPMRQSPEKHLQSPENDFRPLFPPGHQRPS